MAVLWPAYALLSHRLQNALLLVASLFFYACWDWRFVFLLLFTVIVDFIVARVLDSWADRGVPDSARKKLLLVSLAANLGVLGFFKYFDFFRNSADRLLLLCHLQPVLPAVHVLLPIGISFYTFQSMSYTIDVYRRELPAVKNIADFTLFVSFFPHLIAGPIMRAVHLLPQILRPREMRWVQISAGLQLMVWGYFKKMVIADHLAPIVNDVFTRPTPTGFETLMGVYAFAFQIYGDFSGYTDIARGVAKLFGFELSLNFDFPYLSTNPQEFWTRWHITLSNWLKTYLYIPLGGNRRGTTRTYINLLLTMLLGGLWHGAAWTFVFWGLYQGMLLALHRACKASGLLSWKVTSKLGRAVSGVACWLVMFHLVCFGWLLFRAHSFRQVFKMSESLVNNWGTPDPMLWRGVLLLAAPLFIADVVLYFGKRRGITLQWVAPEIRVVAYGVLLYLIVFVPVQPQAFVYFQF